MTRKKRQIYGFIGRKFSNPEVAAIMDDLDLLPEPFITPMIVEQFRSELREKLLSNVYDRQLVRMLVEACWSMLNTDYGRDLIRSYSEKFSNTIPLNRL